MTQIDGSKMDHIGHLGMVLTKTAFPPDKLDNDQFVRAMLNSMIDQLILALVCPAVDKDGKPASPDYVPEMIKRLKDERKLAISLIVSEVKP